MITESLTHCPKCNAPLGPVAQECSQCGILVNKWQEREENVASGNIARYNIAHATSSEFNWTILALVCLVVIAIFFFLERSQ